MFKSKINSSIQAIDYFVRLRKFNLIFLICYVAIFEVLIKLPEVNANNNFSKVAQFDDIPLNKSFLTKEGFFSNEHSRSNLGERHQDFIGKLRFEEGQINEEINKAYIELFDSTLYNANPWTKVFIKNFLNQPQTTINIYPVKDLQAKYFNWDYNNDEQLLTITTDLVEPAELRTALMLAGIETYFSNAISDEFDFFNSAMINELSDFLLKMLEIKNDIYSFYYMFKGTDTSYELTAKKMDTKLKKLFQQIESFNILVSCSVPKSIFERNEYNIQTGFENTNFENILYEADVISACKIKEGKILGVSREKQFGDYNFFDIYTRHEESNNKLDNQFIHFLNFYSELMRASMLAEMQAKKLSTGKPAEDAIIAKYLICHLTRLLPQALIRDHLPLLTHGIESLINAVEHNHVVFLGI